MAKVEMTGYEYMELMNKSRELDALKQEMVDAIEVQISDESSQYVRAYYQFKYPAELLETIRDQVAEQIAQDEQAVKYLYENESPCLVVMSGYFTRDWGNAADSNTVDLRENRKFKKVWDKFEVNQTEEEM